MSRRRWIVGTFTVFLCLGALLSVVGAGTLAVLEAVDPDLPWTPRLVRAYAYTMAGFFALGLFGLLAAAIERLTLGGVPSSEAPVRSVTRKKTVRREDLPNLYQQVKTYIDLEMWDLAYDKAQQIIRKYPDSIEANTLSKTINDLRWKAEPKYVSEAALNRTDEKKMVEKGLQQMLDHVKTYMELEMWELARQKAMTLMREFPETPQANEMAKIFPEIDRKFQEGAGKPVEEKVEKETP